MRPDLGESRDRSSKFFNFLLLVCGPQIRDMLSKRSVETRGQWRRFQNSLFGQHELPQFRDRNFRFELGEPVPKKHNRFPRLEFSFLPYGELAELPPDKFDHGKIAEDSNALLHPFTALLTIPCFGS